VNRIAHDCKVEQKQLEQMFPDLDQLIDLHSKFLGKLFDRFKASQDRYFECIGDILIEFVS
jgi:hypothetical protein